MEYSGMILSIIFATLVASLSQVQGCSELDPLNRSPFHNETDDQKVYYSDYVLFGKPGDTMTGDDYPFSAVDGVQTIEFFIQCLYKTAQDISVDKIYVTGVGNSNNQVVNCPPAPLAKDVPAVVFLRKLDGGPIDNLFEIEFAPLAVSEKNIAEVILDDLTTVCGLRKQDEDDDVCLDVLEEPDCVTYIPKTPAPPTQPATNAAETTKATTMAKETKTTPKAVGSTTPVGKPISNNKDDTYNTQTEGSQSSQGESKTKDNGATVQIISQSLVVFISVLYILV